MMYIKSDELYVAPEIDIVDVAVEHGFAGSIEDPEENPEIDW